jgi:hypothetical protein
MSQLPAEQVHASRSASDEKLMGCLLSARGIVSLRLQQPPTVVHSTLLRASVLAAGHRPRRFPRYPVPLGAPLLHRAQAGALRVRQIRCRAHQPTNTRCLPGIGSYKMDIWTLDIQTHDLP